MQGSTSSIRVTVPADATGIIVAGSPARQVSAPSTQTGSVDLTTLTYAVPAIITGTVDLSTLTYGGGGTVDALTVSLNEDGGGAIVTTFAAPTAAADIVSQINTAMGSTVASLNGSHHLILTGVTLGPTGSLVTGAGGAGTAYTALGVTAAHTTAGTAGTLDGLTVIASSITCTFSPGANDVAIVSALNSAFGTGSASLSGNFLVLVATLSGGTALTALGLAVPSSLKRVYQGGVTFQNTDPINGAWIGPAGISGAGPVPGYYLAPNGGSVTYPPVDISTLYVFASAGGPKINWHGVDLA